MVDTQRFTNDSLVRVIHFLKHYAQPFFHPECIQLFHECERDLLASLTWFCEMYRLDQMSFKDGTSSRAQVDLWHRMMLQHIEDWCKEMGVRHPVIDDAREVFYTQVFVPLLTRKK